MVFLFHYITNSRTHEGDFGPLYRFAQLFRLGWSGVDLFFVLSGFLIGGILLEAKLGSNFFSTFYTRRAYRILPVYYAWLAAYAGLGFVMVHWNLLGNQEIIQGPLRTSVLLAFAQNIVGIPAFAYATFMVAPTWSLAVEEQFYLVSPVLVRYLSLKNLERFLWACVICSPVMRFVFFSYVRNGAVKAHFLMPCRADALALGMLAAILWRSPNQHWLLRRKRWLKLFCGVLAAGFVAMTKFLPGPRTGLDAALQYSWIAIFFTSVLLLVLADREGLLARLTRVRFLQSCSRVSYCFYLLHFGILGMCHWVAFRSTPRIDDLPGLGVTIFAAGLTWAIAQASWKFFEQPLIEISHKATYALNPPSTGTTFDLAS
jgi:peptidoglycan/LPS O-acetylase OafA/YrhL